MTSEYAPKELIRLGREICQSVPGAVFSGVLGDSSHTYGYHRGRSWDIMRGDYGVNDYSVVTPIDKKGPDNAASALDVSMPPDQMKICSGRMMRAMRGNDGRVDAFREFFGTINGNTVTGWDRNRPADISDDAYTSSDKSHLWHMHFSIYREYSENWNILQFLPDVLDGSGNPTKSRWTGNIVTAPPKPIGPIATWPLKTGHYFGLISGGEKSHGGYYKWERPYIEDIQRRLTRLKFPTKVDGTFNLDTKKAVTNWQKAKYNSLTSRYGEIWRDDWYRLFRA